MNLAILIARFPPGVVGGAEIQAQEWARRLAVRHRVTVFTRRDPPSQPASESRDGFVVRRLPRSPIPGWRTCADLRAIDRAVAELVPRPDLLLCFQTFVSGLAGVRVQRRYGIPAVIWIRGEMEYRIEAGWRSRRVGPRVWREAAGLLVQTDEMRAAFLREVTQVEHGLRERIDQRLGVVPNGIALPQGPLERGEGVLCVGRLIESKGFDTVIDALAAREGPGRKRLTLAGDGPDRKDLEARASRLGVEARFEGAVSRERLDELYRTAGSVVLAARRGEGLPNVLLEAMAYARPVIATPVGGVRDLILDDVNGLLVPPNDPGALRRALDRLEAEPELAIRLGDAARETAAAFSWSAVVPRLEAALERYRAAFPS
jgi:glycosyltransferase involved in cell wall biosynthesis